MGEKSLIGDSGLSAVLFFAGNFISCRCTRVITLMGKLLGVFRFHGTMESKGDQMREKTSAEKSPHARLSRVTFRKPFLAAILVAAAAILVYAAPEIKKAVAERGIQSTRLPYVRADFQPFTSPWKWRTAVTQDVNVYRNLFSGVDLFYAGNKKETEVTLQLHPSADPSVLALDFPGATAISEDREGNLVIESPDGLAVLSLPYIYSAKKELKGAFLDRGNNQVGIRFDSSYDRSTEVFVRFNIAYSKERNVVPAVSSARNYHLIPDSTFIINAPAVVNITATKDDSLVIDANGNTKADPGDTLQYTVVATNTGTDATGVNFDDVLDNNTTLVGGTVHASPIAFDDAYTTVGNTRLFVGVAPPAGEPSVTNATLLFTNDTIATDTFSLQSFTAASANGGIVAVNADGSFTYTPPVGFSGTDTFTYTLQNTTDATLTGTGTVTITVNNVVWYVNNALGVNGDGRSNTPFNVLSATTVNGVGGAGDVDAANQIIYLFTGSGNYTGGLQLESGQQLIGNGVALVVSSFTLRAAGTNPTIVNAGGNGVTLSTEQHTEWIYCRQFFDFCDRRYLLWKSHIEYRYHQYQRSGTEFEHRQCDQCRIHIDYLHRWNEQCEPHESYRHMGSCRRCAQRSY